MDTGSHLPKTGMIGELSETRYWIYLLLLPSLVIILLVIAYPTIYGMAISFREMRLTRPGLNGWVGFKHYLVMIDDPVFWVALKNTVLWVTFAVVLELGLGFIAATALNRNVPGTGIFAVLILVPYFLPNVVAGHMWALLLDPRLGVINDILVRIGILNSYKAWFADPNTALAATIFVEAWHGFPFFALLLLAGLKGIPQDLYKAAAVDGAGPIAEFRLITVPMLKSVIAAAVILRVISLVNSPDLLLILTGGGPGDATQVLSLYAFQTAYKDFNFGYASALSVVMFVILMVFAYAYIRLSKIGRE
ncbi:MULTISPECIES: carbohydrate ABC transporter permease [Neorhizobium]|uniref:carbohydrate ABC transporter permease n=1 Tax=Neorhizobium TaxID=1525371 RepID=UPI000CF89146|nr:MULTISPECIES: sugar ABC transporter permease [Neorhizobium]TCV58692.1 carbohydrate ABC transporter membrane protein 1 (CUT1 family) [Neorhizobium sp. S3-V5DH]